MKKSRNYLTSIQIYKQRKNNESYCMILMIFNLLKSIYKDFHIFLHFLKIQFVSFKHHFKFTFCHISPVFWDRWFITHFKLPTSYYTYSKVIKHCSKKTFFFIIFVNLTCTRAFIVLLCYGSEKKTVKDIKFNSRSILYCVKK